MSFILDALRKAEATRQGAPGQVLAVPHPVRSPPQDSRSWLIPVLGLSLLGTALLVVWLLRAPADGMAPTRAAPATAWANDDPPRRAAPPVAPDLSDTRSGVRRLALEAGAAAVPASPAAASPARKRPSGSGPVQPGTVEVRDLLADGSSDLNRNVPASPNAKSGEVRTQSRAPSPAGAASSLPSMQDLIVAGFTLPPMKMDLHVYRDLPEQRAVYINMRKYREGELTPDDVWVERITPEGAILGFEGRSFLLTNR